MCLCDVTIIHNVLCLPLRLSGEWFILHKTSRQPQTEWKSAGGNQAASKKQVVIWLPTDVMAVLSLPASELPSSTWWLDRRRMSPKRRFQVSSESKEKVPGEQ